MKQEIFSSPELANAPYPHFTCERAFVPEVADGMLAVLKSHNDWKYHEESFFEQYEALFTPENAPLLFESYLPPDVRTAIRKKAETFFGTRLKKNFKVVAHKLTDGQSIGIHNDNPLHGHETHRIVVNLNDPFEDRFGGHLIVFNAPPSLENIYQVLRPVHNTAFGFAMSQRSYHAINKVEGWNRYSIVFSFWEDKPSRTPFNIVAYEKKPIARLLKFLIDHHVDEIDHSETNLLTHLVNTYSLLKGWKCSAALCKAGLFHSIYGTPEFQNRAMEMTERGQVIATIGRRAEKIAYLFCISDRESLYENISRLDGSYCVSHAQSHEHIPLTRDEFADLITLDLANSLEQLDRVDISDHTIRKEKKMYQRVDFLLPQKSIDDLEEGYSRRLNRST